MYSTRKHTWYSRVIIEWEKGYSTLQELGFKYWLERVNFFIHKFDQISFFHIYRFYNRVVDGLSKSEVGEMDGLHIFEKLRHDEIIEFHHLCMSLII